jgi:hypothetical protein
MRIGRRRTSPAEPGAQLLKVPVTSASPASWPDRQFKVFENLEEFSMLVSATRHD